MTAKNATHKLTDPAIRNAKPRDVAYNLPDGGGLVLKVPYDRIKAIGRVNSDGSNWKLGQEEAVRSIEGKRATITC